jgi:hypothetical protein
MSRFLFITYLAICPFLDPRPPAKAMALAGSADVTQTPADAKAAADTFKPEPHWKALDEDKQVWLDPKTRRLIVRARVCLREGPLEHLLCSSQTKEHESILATDAKPRAIHAGLIVVAGEPGHPVRFRPTPQPPDGPALAIELQWTKDDKAQKADAKAWIKEERSGKPLKIDWVFGGSELFIDPDSGKTIYAADSGDLITVANFTGAILDLPISSSSNDAERSFVADPAKIPPRGTPVVMIFSPIKKK